MKKLEVLEDFLYYIGFPLVNEEFVSVLMKSNGIYNEEYGMTADEYEICWKIITI